MPWISIKSADKLVYGQAIRLEKNKKIRVESFKGDRWIEITKVDEDKYNVEEHGFENKTYMTNAKDLKRLLKELIDKEFPRSHQLRVNITS